jgi:integrase
MSATSREAWGRLRKLSSGRWQVRYPAPDGRTYTARTEDDKPLTFQTKADARAWLARMHTTIAQGAWVAPAVLAQRRRAEAIAEAARTVGFREYADRWLTMIRETPNRSGKMRAAGTIRDYTGKVEGYLVPEFGDTLVRDIDAERIRAMAAKLDKIPSVLNRNSMHNGITRPVMIVLMMILRQAARDGVISAAPAVSIPAQKPVRHDEDHDPGEDVAEPQQVEALYDWQIMILLAAWCQLRRGEALGLQRRDIQWHDDGTATLHVRRQLKASTGDYSDPKSDAGKRTMSVPRIMRDRLAAHLETNVATEAKAPLVPGSVRSSMPLSNTRWGYIWGDARDASGTPA